MRSRLLLLTVVLFAVSLVNLGSCVWLLVTKLVAGDLAAYAFMILDGLSALGCWLGAVAMLERHRAVGLE